MRTENAAEAKGQTGYEEGHKMAIRAQLNPGGDRRPWGKLKEGNTRPVYGGV